MPMWCPPTPPQQDGDMYVDQTMSFLYDSNVMSETELPPVYVKKEPKRSRQEAGLIENRRAIKIQRKEECTYPPRSLFERPSPAMVKMRRDLRQKYRGGLVRPPMAIAGIKHPVSKPSADVPCLHNWTIHEDNALLKVVQTYQGLSLNLVIRHAGHTPNWDFVADYVNTVSITYRSPKQCRNRYESVLVAREEGKHVIDTSPRKKKQKGSNNVYKFPIPNKSSRPMRTSQLYTQDNNSSFSHLMIQRHDTLRNIISTKKTPVAKTVVNSPMLKNPKHAIILNMLSDAGIDLENPVLPVEVAARRAERAARDKKPTSEILTQKIQLRRGLQTQGNSLSVASSVVSASPAHSSSPSPQVSVVQSTTVNMVTTTAPPSTPPTTLRTQRIVASPLQNSTVVSVSGITPAQLQNATQRLIVSSSPGQAKATVVGTGGTVTGKTISPAQLHMLRQQAQSIKQQLRLHTSGLTSQAVKTTTVTIAGQTAVQVQFTQAQPRTHYVKQGVTVTGKQGITRTITENEMAQLIKRQQQLNQAKLAASASGSQATTMQSISPQVFAQAIQAGTSGTQVATLVKAVSSSGVTQTVIGTPVKALPQGMKNQQQMRTIFQQQLIGQKKIVNPKIASIAQVGKGGVATQLIVGSKPLSTAMTMQQFQQVIRSPISQGPVVLAKGPSRVIPVNTGQGNKPTIQVVAATSQGITTTIRPQASSTLAGALAGIKVQGPNSGQSQHILSQMSAALQGQHVRQGSPVRIQTSTPIVAVTVQSGSPNVQSGASQQTPDKTDHA